MRTMYWLVSFLAVTICCEAAGAAEHQCADLRPERFGAYQFQWENDSFDPDLESDRDYTNGLRLSYVRNPCFREPGRWAKRLARLWCRSGLCGSETPILDSGYAVGQAIYTPTGLRNPRFQPFDRPYAGHLFVSWLVQATTADSEQVERVQTTIDLQLGWLGPHSYAEDVQNGWHRLLKVGEAKGWANQLEDEPTFNLNVLWRRKLGNEYIDFLPHWGFGIGTVATQANLGATARLGTDLSRMPQFGLPQLRRNEKKEWSVLGFVSIDGRYVAHDIFLDGGVFKKRDNFRIDIEDFRYEIKAGLALRWKGLTFHYTWTHRSEEFSSILVGRGGDQDFRSFAITHHLTLP